MKYYRSYTAKKHKLPKRILFFAIVAVLIFVFSLVLGNSLKKDLAEADIDKDAPETVDISGVEKDHVEAVGDAVHDTGIYSGACLVLDGETDAAGANKLVYNIRNEGHGAVSFVAADEGGLKYASVAVSEMSRLPASEKLAGLEVLKGAVQYAKSLGMRCSAVMTASEGEVDLLIAAELYGIGFDEIIIRGFEACLGAEGGDISAAVAYLEGVREVAECDIALVLSSDAYTYARNSYHIEKLFTYCEFLGVDMTGCDGDTAAAFADGFAGSISAYSLRAIINAEDTAARDALDAAGEKIYQYISTAEVPTETTGE